jgi:hypothetical protein
MIRRTGGLATAEHRVDVDGRTVSGRKALVLNFSVDDEQPDLATRDVERVLYMKQRSAGWQVE